MLQVFEPPWESLPLLCCNIWLCSLQGGALVPGYAPFCKHIFVPNFVGAKLGALPITDSNRRHLQCGYSRRRPEELAVLTRFAAVIELCY